MKLNKIKKTVGDFQLNIEELTIETGRIHGFIGGNGCGKTTTAKLITGILEPDSGILDYEGLRPQEVTMTSQRPYLLHDTVYANLIYPLKIRGIRPDQEKLDALLEEFGMKDKKKQYARSLSSGEQQKLSMLRAMVFEPKLIIVDESLSNMDPESVEKFESLILEQQKQNPITWILISHRLTQLNKMCQSLHFFDRGVLVASGTREEILFDHPDERIRRFVSNEMLIREQS